MNNDKQFDVIVIGGGPAGATAATLVAKQKHKVLLLERDRFPRHQVGESLLSVTLHGLCPLLGVEEEIKKAGFTYKRGGTFYWGNNEEPWHLLFNNSMVKDGPVGYSYHVERDKFDDILLQNARKVGVEVCEEHRVVGTVAENGRIIGVHYQDPNGNKHEARARIVVDASGSHSPLHRAVGQRVYSEFFKNVAVYGYYRGGKPVMEPFPGNVLTVAFEWGWFWYIPLSDGMMSVGAVLGLEHAKRLSQHKREDMWQACIDACPVIRDSLADAERITEGAYGKLRVRKAIAYCNSNFWTPGLLLTGDAACFLDPVFAPGVHLATYSGLLAARSINSWLRGDFDETTCFNEFQAHYRNEYSRFYQLLLGIYDIHEDNEARFWQARSIANTAERHNTSLVSLISGIGNISLNESEQFFADRSDLGKRYQGMIDHSKETAVIPQISSKYRVDDIDEFSDMFCSIPGLVASTIEETNMVATPDGVHWREAWW